MASFRLTAAGLTDVGLRRDHNEDYFFIEPRQELYILADGMGGHASGEVASQLAVQEFAEFYTRVLREPAASMPYDTRGLGSREEQVVANGVLKANDRVFIESMRDRRYDGMGTTLCVLAGVGDKMVLAHVGDSRIYRYRNGTLTQLTEDHSLINHLKRSRNMSEAEVKSISRSKNVIVRAVGLKEYVEPDVQVVEKKHGDVFLMCSDGLSDLVEDWVMEAVLESADGNYEEACTRLVRLANQGGGKDNITVVIVGLVDPTASDHRAAPARSADKPVDTDVSQVVIGAPLRGQPAPQAGSRGGRPHAEGRYVVDPGTDRAATSHQSTTNRGFPRTPEAPAGAPLPPPIPRSARDAFKGPTPQRGRDRLRDTVPRNAAMRIGATRIGDEEPVKDDDARGWIAAGGVPTGHDDETIDMDASELQGEVGDTLRDTIRMPQAFAVDTIQRMQAQRDADKRATAAAELPEDQKPTIPQMPSFGSAPSSDNGRAASAQPNEPTARMSALTGAESAAAPTATSSVGSRAAASAPAASDATASVPAGVPSSGVPATLGDSMQFDPDATLEMESPAKGLEHSVFGVANDPFDPASVISHELLRAIFRRARVAPLPPLPPQESELDW